MLTGAGGVRFFVNGGEVTSQTSVGVSWTELVEERKGNSAKVCCVCGFGVGWAKKTTGRDRAPRRPNCGGSRRNLLGAVKGVQTEVM